MKIQWEESDVRSGRHVWRDAECIIGTDPEDWRAMAVILVLESGRVMRIGTKEEIASYLTEHGYRPTKDK
jgi:hypothetical protein